MSGHQAWLEKPYDERAEQSEADERAQELGYEDAEDMYECLRDDAADAAYERQKDRRLFGEED